MPEGCDPHGANAYQQRIRKEGACRIASQQFVKRIKSDAEKARQLGHTPDPADASYYDGINDVDRVGLSSSLGRPPAHPYYVNPITHQEFSYGDMLRSVGQQQRSGSRSGKRTSGYYNKSPAGSRPPSSQGSVCSYMSNRSSQAATPRTRELTRRIEQLERTLLEERTGRSQVQQELSMLQSMLETYVTDGKQRGGKPSSSDGAAQAEGGTASSALPPIRVPTPSAGTRPASRASQQ
eukprot:PhM_4_TR10892/c0_g1_i1/m.19558